MFRLLYPESDTTNNREKTGHVIVFLCKNFAPVTGKDGLTPKVCVNGTTFVNGNGGNHGSDRTTGTTSDLIEIGYGFYRVVINNPLLGFSYIVSYLDSDVSMCWPVVNHVQGAWKYSTLAIDSKFVDYDTSAFSGGIPSQIKSIDAGPYPNGLPTDISTTDGRVNANVERLNDTAFDGTADFWPTFAVNAKWAQFLAIPVSLTILADGGSTTTLTIPAGFTQFFLGNSYPILEGTIVGLLGLQEMVEIKTFNQATRTVTFARTLSEPVEANEPFIFIQPNGEGLHSSAIDAIISAIGTSGTIGDIASQVWGEGLPANYELGSAGYILGRMARAHVTVNGTVDENGTIKITRNSTYNLQGANEIVVSAKTPSNWPTLTGLTLKLRVDVKGVKKAFTGSVKTDTTTDKSVAFAMTASDTSTLPTGRFNYQLWANGTISGTAINRELSSGSVVVIDEVELES